MPYISGSEGRVTKGFTLVELLIVIAILAILSTAVSLILNPVELLAQARDSQRISDMIALRKTVDFFVVSDPGGSLGADHKVYISLPDSSADCAGISGLPSLPSGWSYNCVSSVNLRSTGGSGWVPINFNQMPGGSSLPYLPVDQANAIDSGKYYIYVPEGWAFASPLESSRYIKGVASNDGGFDPIRFEVGKDLRVIAIINQMVGLWNFNEGSGSTLGEIGVSGNDGVIFGDPQWVSGRSGSALLFDGNGDFVRLENQTGDSFTLSIWFKTSTPSLSGSACSDGNGLVASDVVGIGNDFSVNLINNHICFFTGNPDESVEGSSVVTDGNWHNAIVSRERGGLKKIYLDGVPDGSGIAGNNVLNNNLNIEFGGSTVTGKYFSGIIDGVLIYNRILSDKEMAALYNTEL